MKDYPAQKFAGVSRCVVKEPEWFGVPASPARIEKSQWSTTFGQWSYYLAWPCGRKVWFCESYLGFWP